MQPLSKVRSQARCTWGESDILLKYPNLAANIAQCIADFSEVETMLGLFLAILLNTDSQAALSMYASLENRSAQRRMILAAVEAKLPQDHSDVIHVAIQTYITPAMKQRDKLAHWCWGHSPDISDAFLLTSPENKTERHFNAVHLNDKNKAIVVSNAEPDDIFVVREGDLKRISTDLRAANRIAALCAATVWEKNTPQERAEHLQQLSNEPRILEGLARLPAQKNNQEAQQPSPQLGRNG